jgi:hypothetical protein
MNDQAATISHAKDTLIELVIRFGPRLLAATGEIYAAVLGALRARGVVIPPPQREVRLIGQPA